MYVDLYEYQYERSVVLKVSGIQILNLLIIRLLVQDLIEYIEFVYLVDVFLSVQILKYFQLGIVIWGMIVMILRIEGLVGLYL